MYKKSNELQEVVNVMKQGGVAILPTDTLYAISSLASHDEAVHRIFDIKQRDIDNLVPVFVSSIDQVRDYAVMNEEACKLAIKFWPGPLTLIMQSKAKGRLSPLTHNDKIAIRIPDSHFILRIIDEIGEPIVGTSANISGSKDPIMLKDIAEDLLKAADIVLDDNSMTSQHSTIVDTTSGNAVLIRQGKLKI